MLQPCGIDTGLKEHSNRVYLPPRSTLRRVRQDLSLLIQVQPRKHFSTQTLSMNYTKHTTPQLFSKKFYLVTLVIKLVGSPQWFPSQYSPCINSSPLKGLIVVQLYNS
ncbi:hypothetical protein HKD37_14G040129 [Glycine soja]